MSEDNLENFTQEKCNTCWLVSPKEVEIRRVRVTTY